MAKHAHRGRALWLAYLPLGLRRGEALGLTWPDLDLDAGLATIHQSLRRRAGKRVDHRADSAPPEQLTLRLAAPNGL